jgi:type IV secretion system protein VirB3
MRAEFIFTGATRPALIKGVPLKPALWLVCGGSLLMVVLAVYVTWLALVAIPLIFALPLLWMREATKEDDQRLHQLRLKAKMRWIHRRNWRLWKAESYSPQVYDGASDGFRH